MDTGELDSVTVELRRMDREPEIATVAATLAWTAQAMAARAMAARAMAARAVHYEVWSEPPEVECANVRFLAGYRRGWLFDADLLGCSSSPIRPASPAGADSPDRNASTDLRKITSGRGSDLSASYRSVTPLGTVNGC